MSPPTATRSAGIALYRWRAGRIEIFLGHMGGPFWSRRDERAWTIPKGECEPDESDLDVARREFREEIGHDVPAGALVDLGEIRQSARKVVRVYAVEGEVDANTVRSNSFEMEWPRGSGRIRSFPEIDRAAWFDLRAARPMIIAGQVEVLDRLAEMAHRREQP